MLPAVAVNKFSGTVLDSCCDRKLTMQLRAGHHKISPNPDPYVIMGTADVSLII